jgi:hypothetical protein
LQVIGKRGRLGAVFTALASLCVDDGVVLKGGTKVDFHNIMNVFTGAGLVVKRDAYVLVRGAMTKTSFVYLARFAPKNANVVVEGLLVTNKELVGLCDAIELELEKKGKTTHGAATENALKELMKSVLRGNGFGWSESDTANKPKIQKLYARVRGKLVADGKVAVITASLRNGKTMQALQLARFAGATADAEDDAISTADDVTAGVDFHDAPTDACNTRGGGALELETRVEDLMVAMCDVAGDRGVNISEAARLFGYSVKSFGGRCDFMARKRRDAFLVEQFAVKEGSQTKKYLRRVRTDATDGQNAGTDGSASTAGNAGTAGTANKTPAEVLQSARAAKIMRFASERGYLVGGYLGRMLKQEENRETSARDPNAVVTDTPLVTKVVSTVLAPLLAQKKLRAVSVTKPRDALLESTKTQTEYVVYFSQAFPDPTDAMKTAIGREIADTEHAMKQQWWAEKKDVFDITKRKDTPGSAVAVQVAPTSAVVLLPSANENVKSPSDPRDIASWAQFVTSVAPKSPEEAANLQKLPTWFLKNVAALCGGHVAAPATRMKLVHVFFASAIFSETGANEPAARLARVLGDQVTPSASPETESHAMDLTLLFRKRAPLTLALQVFKIPEEQMRLEPPATAAALVKLASEGKTLGDLTAAQFILICGAPESDQFTDQQKTLGMLMYNLCSVDLLRRVETREGERYALARSARFEKVHHEPAPTEIYEHRVCLRYGLEAYWSGLEDAFTSDAQPEVTKGTKQKMKPKPEHAKGAYPNKQFIEAQRVTKKTGTLGFCAGRIWSDTKAIPFVTRVFLLDAFELHRLGTHSVYVTKSGEGGSGGSSTETQTRLAMKHSVLSPWALPESEVKRLETFPCPARSVRDLWDQDQTRVVNDLVWDGSLTKTEMNSTHGRDPRSAGFREGAGRRRKRTRKGEATEVDDAEEEVEDAGDAEEDAGDAETETGPQDTDPPEKEKLKRNRVPWTLLEDMQLLLAATRALILHGGKPDLFNAATRAGELSARRTPDNSRKRYNNLVNGDAHRTWTQTEHRTDRGDAIDAVVESFGRTALWSTALETKLLAEIGRVLTEFPKGSSKNYYKTPQNPDGIIPDNAPNHGGPEKKGKKRKLNGAADADAADDDDGAAAADDDNDGADAADGAADADAAGDDDDASDSEDDVPIAAMLPAPPRKPVAAPPPKPAPKKRNPPVVDSSSEDELSLDNKPLATMMDVDSSPEMAASPAVPSVGVPFVATAMDPPSAMRRASVETLLVRALLRDEAARESNPGKKEKEANPTCCDFDTTVSRLANNPEVVVKCLGVLKKAGLIETALPGDGVAGGIADADVSNTRLASAFRAATNDPALGSFGDAQFSVSGAAAHAARALRDAPLSNLERSRCPSPSLGETLALLSAAANGDVRLDVADADHETAPPAFPETGGSHVEDPPEHNSHDLHRRVVVLAAQGRGNSRLGDVQVLNDRDFIAARAAAAATAVASAEALAKARPIAISIAVEAAIKGGENGITAWELSEANGGEFSTLACVIALTTATENGSLVAVNAYTEVRYVAPTRVGGLTFSTEHENSTELVGALPWRSPDGQVDEPFLAGLKRTVLSHCCKFPGITVDDLANLLTPALTPVAGVVLVERMLASGELVVSETSAPISASGAPPLILQTKETKQALALAQNEAPQRHVVPAGCSLWPE